MVEEGWFWTGARRLLSLFLYGQTLSSWEAAVRERRGEKLRYRYYLGRERAEEDKVRIWAFWDGKKWVEKELRARIFRSYFGAWWKAFWLSGLPDIIIMRRPYSPREWAPE